MKENAGEFISEKLDRVAYLVDGYIRNSLAKKEQVELDAWINSSDENMKLFEELTDPETVETNVAWMDGVQTENSYQALKDSGLFELPKRTRKRGLWLAAAGLLLLVAAFYLLQLTRNKPVVNGLVIEDPSFLQPGSSRASLTLSDGKIIDLTDIKAGPVASDAGMQVREEGGGALQYEADSSSMTAGFHTLSTPEGGQYQVKLPDGSNVWLNAASSLRYPVAFTAALRSVTLRGEAYFEVAKNAGKPFKVLLADSSYVLVTGTHFNVHAYGNEAAKEVTLVEGRVTVGNTGGQMNLEPGTQALLEDNGIAKRTLANAAEVTGWKDGLFVFKDATIETVMQQLERWYAAKIVYTSRTPQLFNASIGRKEPLARVLKLLELNGYVHFKTIKDTVYVLP